MIQDALWIGCDMGDVCPAFVKEISIKKPLKCATMSITSYGVYEAYINGNRVGNFILAPGCTAYDKRLQYQQYAITDMLSDMNEVTVLLGKGWQRGRIGSKRSASADIPAAILCEIVLEYTDGECDTVRTDSTWEVRESAIRFSDIYDGERYDASLACTEKKQVTVLELGKENLIPQEGEIICEHEQISPVKLFTTPKGETVIDFGQNLAGYIEVSVHAKAGERVSLSFAEVLDSSGNFYTENYRSAKSEYIYTCCDGNQVYKPHFTFYGFRYVRVNEFPEKVDLHQFKAIAIYSDMRRIGNIESAVPKINQLFSNTIWSQRCNFIDIPTDCPQRDERMGWSGDAQVFALTAGYNYDVLKFFRKWLADVRAEQRTDGSVPDVIPNFVQTPYSSTAWGDVITIAPYQMYRLFGDKTILEENFESMKKWVEYMRHDSEDEFLWTYVEKENQDKHKHYGDWLALDAPYGSYKGITDSNFIASAFFAYSTSLLIKTGKAIGRDVAAYEDLYDKIVKTFKQRFSEFHTQTEHVLALYMHLTDHVEETAAALDKMIRKNGNKLQTGFVGTPYLLYALSENGYTKTAYDLLFQEENPSWLYEINQGATTIWEHWDGIKEDGTFWSKDMNSYNHYAYGSVIDWIYATAGGIKPDDAYPGFEKAVIAPVPDQRMQQLKITYESRHGKIISFWTCQKDCVRYEITTPVETKIIIDGKETVVQPGSYIMYGKL